MQNMQKVLKMARNEISILKEWGWKIGKNEQFFQLYNNPMIAIK